MHRADIVTPSLVVLQTHPVQYQAPLYRTLASRGRISIKVLYLTAAGALAYMDPGFSRSVEWDLGLLEGYDYAVLQRDRDPSNSTFWSRHDPRLRHELTAARPHWVLVHGYASRMNWVAVRWAKAHTSSVAYFSDSNGRLIGRTGATAAIKRRVLRHFFSRVDAFLSPSDANHEYLVRFGADAAKIRWCPFGVDLPRFESTGSGAVGNAVDFVWAGKMIDVKRPFDFVDALAEVWRRGVVRVSATMIGSGPLLEPVMRHAHRVLPPGTVSFTGFVNQVEIPAALSRGPVFVFTSGGDAYGMIVTEAVACGRALIVADVNGCVGETGSAQPGRNAYAYRAGDVPSLADCMQRLLEKPKEIVRLREGSRRIARQHDVSCAATVIESIIEANTANA